MEQIILEIVSKHVKDSMGLQRESHSWPTGVLSVSSAGLPAEGRHGCTGASPAKSH